jgi:putative ABC transport system ATP-binding protein
VIALTNICKTYQRASEQTVSALADVSLDIERGELLALRGASGSGKSSLLNIIGCLDRPSSGRYELEGMDVSSYSDRQLSALRARRIGFIFQSFNLLPRTTAVENIELAMIYAARGVDRRRALKSLARVGLEARAHHYSTELSGGEQQRVAIARALINDPPLILADEPTGNLDAAAAAQVMSLLKELNGEGRTIVLVTHDETVAAHAPRTVHLNAGRVIADMAPRAALAVEKGWTAH